MRTPTAPNDLIGRGADRDWRDVFGHTSMTTEARSTNLRRDTRRWPGSRMGTLKPLPKVRIYRARPSAMQSGRAQASEWTLEFEPWRKPFIEPLMGWTGSRDSFRQIRLKFPDRQSAIEFARRNGWEFEASDPCAPKPVRKSYARQLRNDTRAVLDQVRPWQAEAPSRPAAIADVRRAWAGSGQYDPVEEADLESFPASDPPAWTGATAR